MEAGAGDARDVLHSPNQRRDNASGSQDQDVYLKALASSGNVDLIEYGYYVSKVKTRPMAVPDRKDRPKLVHSGWPVKVKTGAMVDDPNATFMVSIADREEKGSDVNVAAHLMSTSSSGRSTRLS